MTIEEVHESIPQKYMLYPRWYSNMVLITFLLKRQTGENSQPYKAHVYRNSGKMKHRRRQKRIKKKIKWFKSEHSLLISL